MLTADLIRLQISEGDALLDLGAGFGRHAFAALRRGASVVALDAGVDEVKSVRGMFNAMTEVGEVPANSVAEVVRGDVLELPFENKSFDVLICSEVMEHISDDERAMGELARVVKPGGRVAVTVPRTLPERVNWALSDEYHNVPGGHIRIYTRRELEQLLRSSGFIIDGHAYVHGLHSPYWWIKCMVGTTNDQNWVVQKFHALLVWDIMKAPRVTRFLEVVLSPVLGKSLVVYATKTGAR